MSIYTDGQHVVSDTSVAELHAWAIGQNLGRHWYHRGRWPHYDIPKGMQRRRRIGAFRTTTRGLINCMRKGLIFWELASGRAGPNETRGGDQ